MRWADRQSWCLSYAKRWLYIITKNNFDPGRSGDKIWNTAVPASFVTLLGFCCALRNIEAIAGGKSWNWNQIGEKCFCNQQLQSLYKCYNFCAVLDDVHLTFFNMWLQIITDGPTSIVLKHIFDFNGMWLENTSSAWAQCFHFLNLN